MLIIKGQILSKNLSRNDVLKQIEIQVIQVYKLLKVIWKRLMLKMKHKTNFDQTGVIQHAIKERALGRKLNQIIWRNLLNELGLKIKIRLCDLKNQFIKKFLHDLFSMRNLKLKKFSLWTIVAILRLMELIDLLGGNLSIKVNLYNILQECLNKSEKNFIK